MNAAEEELETVYDKLEQYKTIIENGDTLDEVKDALELDVENGQIWLHPQEDGTTVKLHLKDETDDFNYHGESARIGNHLIREVGFPTAGKFEPFDSYFASHRQTTKFNYGYFQ